MLYIGVDFGGTKIEAAALDADGNFLSRQRKPNPGNYADALKTVGDLIHAVEAEAHAKTPSLSGRVATIGVGAPGSVSPRTGVMRNANSTWLNGKTFRVWKFRSMRCDAEKDGVPRWAGASDDRVTRVGHFIRKVRIDEIPQIINVLAGDMSFIGPRPERPFFVEELHKQIPYYGLRHRVKPGITGWAQVNYPYGASIEDAKRKLAYDLYYVKRNEVFLDFTILIQTVRVILFAQGAR